MTLLSHSAIYFVGNFIRYAASFIMLPIYTNYLSPKEYGVVELLVLAVDLIAIAVGMRLGQGVFKYYSEQEGNQQGRKSVVNSALLIAILTNTFGVFIVFLFAPFYLDFLDVETLSVVHIQVFALSLLFSSMIEIYLLYVRAVQKPFVYVSFNVLKLVVQIAFNVYFIVFLEEGVVGVIKATVISSGVSAFIAMILWGRSIGLSLDFSFAKRLIGYSWPILVAEVGMFLVTYLDRFFLKELIGHESVGIYALASRFSILIIVFGFSPFQAVWDSEKYKVQKSPDAQKKFREVFLLLNLILISAALSISLYVEEVIEIMTPESYWMASTIVPIMVIGMYFQSLTAFVNFGILLKGKTLDLTKASFMSVAISLLLYYNLIPIYGVYGAASASALTMACRFFFVFYMAKRHYDMGIQWGATTLLLGFASILYLISMNIEYGIVIDIILKALVILSLFIVVWFSKYLTNDMKEMIYTKVKARLPIKK